MPEAIPDRQHAECAARDARLGGVPRGRQRKPPGPVRSVSRAGRAGPVPGRVPSLPRNPWSPSSSQTRQRAFADIKAAIELRCENAQPPLSIQEVCDMSALRDLLPARRTRAVSRAALTAAIVCGGFVVASGETAHGDDPTVLNGTYRMYFDGQGSTVDGVPVYKTAETYSYAFRSACLAD